MNIKNNFKMTTHEEEGDEMKPFMMTREPTFAIFSAKRRSGKTHMITYLMYSFHALYQNVVIINPTAFNGFYKQYTNNIVENFDDKLIEQLMRRQKELTRLGKRNHVLLILDDCLSMANFNSPVFLQMATQGRHYQVSCWISTQHYMKVPQSLRMNVDYMFIMGNQKGEVLKNVFDELAGYFDSEKEFIACVKKNLANYGCFVLDNTEGSYHRIQAPAILPKFFLNMKKKK
jgi:hypothetical protein